MIKTAARQLSLCIGGALLGADPAQAQAYPDRPIKVVVPFPAGGPTDGMARIVSDRLGTVLGQSIVIENKGGGAGGSIGAKFVASADPDGYTILITPGGSLTTGPAVHKNIGYDPVKAFVPVAQLIETPLIIERASVTAGEDDGRARRLCQGQSRQDQLGLAGLRRRAASAARTVQARSRHQYPARALSRHRADALRDPRRRSPGRRRSDDHEPAHIEAGKLRPIAIAGDVRTSEAARRADRDRSWLPEVAIAVLARRRGAGGHAAGDHRQAQHGVPRKPQAAGDAARCWPSSAPRSRSARRPSSAKCWPRSSSCGPASSTTPTSRWSERRSTAGYGGGHEVPARQRCCLAGWRCVQRIQPAHGSGPRTIRTGRSR